MDASGAPLRGENAPLKTLSDYDREWLWAELAHAVQHKRPLPTVLNELAHAHSHGRRGQALRSLNAAMAAGKTLADAVGEAGVLFPPGCAEAVRAGEESGELAHILQSLSESTRVAAEFRFSIARILSYPLVISIFAIAVILLIDLLIYPAFMEMFNEMDMELPSGMFILIFGTQITSLALMTPFLLIMVFLFLISPGALPWRGTCDAIRLWFPLLGRRARSVALARWCSTFGLLLNAGVTEPLAARLAGRSTGNARVAAISDAVAAEVAQGANLGAAMEKQRFFPPPLTWMVLVAENSGGHGEVWPVAHELYRVHGEGSGYVISLGISVLFIFLAVNMVGGAVIGLFLPLIKLMSSMSG